jgi:hypothetical protein
MVEKKNMSNFIYRVQRVCIYGPGLRPGTPRGPGPGMGPWPWRGVGLEACTIYTYTYLFSRCVYMFKLQVLSFLGDRSEFIIRNSSQISLHQGAQGQAVTFHLLSWQGARSRQPEGPFLGSGLLGIFFCNPIPYYWNTSGMLLPKSTP